MSDGEELWASLELGPHQQVVDAILLARVTDFDQGGTLLSMAGTEGADWIVQLGLIEAAKLLITRAGYHNTE